MAKVEPIPVTLVTEAGRLMALDGETALLRLQANTGHGHADGAVCLACAGRMDVRTQLFDLLEGMRQGLRPAFSRVVVDASAVADKERLVAALTGRLPAGAMRDHAVARAFVLVG
jgi:hypothetical protein